MSDNERTVAQASANLQQLLGQYQSLVSRKRPRNNIYGIESTSQVESQLAAELQRQSEEAAQRIQQLRATYDQETQRLRSSASQEKTELDAQVQKLRSELGAAEAAEWQQTLDTITGVTATVTAMVQKEQLLQNVEEFNSAFLRDFNPSATTSFEGQATLPQGLVSVASARLGAILLVQAAMAETVQTTLVEDGQKQSTGTATYAHQIADISAWVPTLWPLDVLLIEKLIFQKENRRMPQWFLRVMQTAGISSENTNFQLIDDLSAFLVVKGGITPVQNEAAIASIARSRDQQVESLELDNLDDDEFERATAGADE